MQNSHKSKELFGNETTEQSVLRRERIASLVGGLIASSWRRDLHATAAEVSNSSTAQSPAPASEGAPALSRRRGSRKR